MGDPSASGLLVMTPAAGAHGNRHLCRATGRQGLDLLWALAWRRSGYPRLLQLRTSGCQAGKPREAHVTSVKPETRLKWLKTGCHQTMSKWEVNQKQFLWLISRQLISGQLTVCGFVLMSPDQLALLHLCCVSSVAPAGSLPHIRCAQGGQCRCRRTFCSHSP